MISLLDKYSRNGAARLVGLQYPGYNIIHGHTHVVGYMQYYDRVYVDNGCLSLLEPSYLKGPTYWGQAITLVDKGSIRLLPISNHRVLFGEYKF